MAKDSGMSKQMGMSKEMGMSREMSMNSRGGHLYMQTDEIRNCMIHYHRSVNGTLTEVQRVVTGGADSGTYKPISGSRVHRTPRCGPCPAIRKTRVQASSFREIP